MRILNKESELRKNKIVVTKTIEEELTEEKLGRIMQNLQRQKQGIISQSKRLQEQYNAIIEQEKEVQEYLNLLSNEGVDIEIKDA